MSDRSRPDRHRRLAALAPVLAALLFAQGANASKLENHSIGEAMTRSDSGGYLIAGVTQPCYELGFIGCADSKLFVASLTRKGALHKRLGHRGVAKVPLGASSVDLAGMAIQDDGKIVIAGGGVYPRAAQIVLARLTRRGRLDGSFGTGGETMLAGFAAGGNNAVAIDALGRIVVAGSTDENGKSQFAAARFSATGAIDESFGTAGIASINVDPETARERANAIAVRPDGGVVLAGGAGPDGNLSHGADSASLDVAQFTPDGQPDSSFGAGGVTRFGSLSLPAGPLHADLRSLVLDAAGNAYAAGSVSGGFHPCGQFTVAKLTADGAFASDFGTDGIAEIATPACVPAADIALSSQGDLFVSGSYGSIVLVGDAGTAVVARLDPSGSLDGGFANGGLYKLRPAQQSTALDAIAVRGHGVVGAGYMASDHCRAAHHKTKTCQALLVEALRPNGKLRRGFAARGRLTIPAIRIAFEPGHGRA